MILTTYIFKSVLCMAILMLFYKAFLESEKLHRFNRGYLLAAIVLSIAIPFMPVGIDFMNDTSPETAANVLSTTSDLVINQESALANSYSLWDILFVVYLIGFGYTFVRFVRNIIMLMYKVMKHDAVPYEGATLVLLDERISPFTFLGYIFVNRTEYEEGRTDAKLLSHELSHALGHHSIDVLFVEITKTIFWFNPLLMLYKTAIQLNHEFLADEAVIVQYQEVKSYQYLLLDTIKNNNKIYLASNINFHLTKKRLQMMTKESSSTRKRILFLGTIPLGLLLILAFGKPAIAQLGSSTKKTEQVDPSEKDRYFANTLVHYKTEDGRTKVISYKSLPADVKAMIPMPPPPPSPPNPPGSTAVTVKQKLTPLPSGTVVHIKEDGRVMIGSTDDGVTPPPPPPAPAAPPAPPTLDELLEEGAKFYINGKLVDNETAKDLWTNHEDDIKTINVKGTNAEKKRVDIVTKQ